SSVCSTQVAAIAQPLTPSASTSLKFPSTASSGEWLLIQGCENVAVPFWSWTGTAAAGTAVRTQIGNPVRRHTSAKTLMFLMVQPSFPTGTAAVAHNAAAVPRATALRRCESVPAACYAMNYIAERRVFCDSHANAQT